MSDPRLPELRRMCPAFAEAEALIDKSRADPTGEQKRLRDLLARQDMRDETMALAARAKASRAGVGK